MAERGFDYVIAGAGQTGASAAAGIREIDKTSSVMLIGNEQTIPYERPDLSKKLWFGKKQIQDVFVYDSAFYVENGIEMVTGVELTGLDAAGKILTDNRGNDYRYGKLLLATGGIPRTLSIPGGDLWGLCYYRYIPDYLRIRRDTKERKSAVVIGGGFIGSEVAAALKMQEIDVTMVFPEQYIVGRVFPQALGERLQNLYIERGIKILNADTPTAIETSPAGYKVHTKNGAQLQADIVIVGIGIKPETSLAEKAGLTIENGISVDKYLRTSNPDIFAAGDNAFFEYIALGKKTRVEHWDNAANQGKQAGRNMAGANEPYEYMPYFFSDLFEFGYEAVGEIDSSIETFGDWQKELDTGVLYYMKDGNIKGVMTCNIYGKMDEARQLIRSGKQITPDDLRGAIRG